MKQILFAGIVDAINSSTTEYTSLITPNPNQWNATLANREQLISDSCILKSLTVKLNNAPGSGNSYTFTVYKNGSSTSLSLTISDTDTTGQNYDDEISLSPGDRIALECSPSGTPTTGRAWWSSELDFTEEDEHNLICGSSSNIADGSVFPLRSTIEGGASWVPVPLLGFFANDYVCAKSGVIKDFYVESSVAPGSGASYIFRLYKNGVSTSLTATISGSSSTTASDTTNQVSVNARDQLRLEVTKSGTIATANFIWGFTFDTNIADRQMIQCGSDDTLNASATEYNFFSAINTNWNATLNNRTSQAKCCRVIDLYIEAGSAVGSGASDGYDFELIKNGVATGMMVSLRQSATTGNTTGNAIEVGDLDELALRSTPQGSPNAVPITWSWTVDTDVPQKNSIMMGGMGV